MKMNILKGAVAAPFKLAKAILEAMKAMLNSILKIFGIKGFAPAHTAEAPTPENALFADEMTANKAKGNDLAPNLEMAKKLVPDPVLGKIQAFAMASSEDRKKVDLSGLSPSLKAVLATMSPDQLKAIGEMDREKARVIVFNGLKEMKIRERQMTKTNKALANIQPSPAEQATAEVKSERKKGIDAEKLKDRINRRKQPKKPALAFGM